MTTIQELSTTKGMTNIQEFVDDVDQFEIDQLHILVDQFASEVTISDSQGE